MSQQIGTFDAAAPPPHDGDAFTYVFTQTLLATPPEINFIR